MVDGDCVEQDLPYCVGGYCVPAACTLETCPLLYWCNPETGRCLEGCDEDLDCLVDRRCDLDTHDCVPR